MRKVDEVKTNQYGQVYQGENNRSLEFDPPGISEDGTGLIHGMFATMEDNEISITLRNAVKKIMGSGELAPNAPITVTGGWMRNPVSGKPVHIKGKGSSAPLIDTGSLRSSITHVVEGE